MYWWLFLLCPLAYLIGGINSAKNVTKAQHVDLSKVGSGNSGATNVGRAMGFKWFLVVTLLDVFKGACVALIGYLYCSLYTQNFAYTEAHYIIILAMGLAAIIGAIFPVWYKFKGGKGIATWIGIAFFINPIVMCLAAVIFIPILLLIRLMSVCTLLGVIYWVVASLIFNAPRTVPVIILYCCFIVILVYSHRKNVVRIFTGKENKLTFKKTEKVTK